jgi:hypothetical protein
MSTTNPTISTLGWNQDIGGRNPATKRLKYTGCLKKKLQNLKLYRGLLNEGRNLFRQTSKNHRLQRYGCFVYYGYSRWSKWFPRVSTQLLVLLLIKLHTLSRVPDFVRIYWQELSTRCFNTSKLLVGSDYIKFRCYHNHTSRGLKLVDRASQLTGPQILVHCRPKAHISCRPTLRTRSDCAPSCMNCTGLLWWVSTFCKYIFFYHDAKAPSGPRLPQCRGPMLTFI